MSTFDDVLTILFSYSTGYKRLRELARGDTWPRAKRGSFRKEKREISDSGLRSTLCRMRKNGLVIKLDDIWTITPKGKTLYETRQAEEKRKELMLLNRKKKKTVIIAFDVPECERRKRDWLREELLVLGFEPIQKSVWFGPGPLPESFVKELNEEDVLRCVKFFKANEEELV